MLDSVRKPSFDAPMVSWTPLLVIEGVNGHSYNVVAYGDLFWAVRWGEAPFDVDRFMAGEAKTPVLVGKTVEELSFALDLMYPRREDKPIAGEALSRDMDQRACNLYVLREDARRRALAATPEAPESKNESIPKVDLFEPGDGRPICIISPAPSRTCNYRCEYCYHHEHGFTKNAQATESWRKAALTAVAKIPRPLMLSMGAMGEPLFIPLWRQTAVDLLRHDNVRRLSFVSNLSIDPASFLEEADPARIGVVASLHPSEFKDVESDFQTFLTRLIWLKERGASLVVNYVLTPSQIADFTGYRQILRNHGIPMTSNILRGPFRGKMYPEAYTRDELATIRAFYDEAPFIYDYQSHLKDPFGSRCTSGRYVFHLEFDGTLYNCHFARQRLGSIYDQKLMVRRENGFCTARKCESQTTIGVREDVVRRYRMAGNMHYFAPRLEGDEGENPFE